MKLIDIKKWKTKLDRKDLVSVHGGATDNEKSYEYYWTHLISINGSHCYEQDSREYDTCGFA
jgi:hypothetical protein